MAVISVTYAWCNSRCLHHSDPTIHLTKPMGPSIKSNHTRQHVSTQVMVIGHILCNKLRLYLRKDRCWRRCRCIRWVPRLGTHATSIILPLRADYYFNEKWLSEYRRMATKIILYGILIRAKNGIWTLFNWIRMLIMKDNDAKAIVTNKHSSSYKIHHRSSPWCCSGRRWPWWCRKWRRPHRR